ncbi:hypothetical protein SRHO_G00115010 [Serrasalmus rhombeus]
MCMPQPDSLQTGLSLRWDSLSTPRLLFSLFNTTTVYNGRKHSVRELTATLSSAVHKCKPASRRFKALTCCFSPPPNFTSDHSLENKVRNFPLAEQSHIAFLRRGCGWRYLQEDERRNNFQRKVLSSAFLGRAAAPLTAGGSAGRRRRSGSPGKPHLFLRWPALTLRLLRVVFCGRAWLLLAGKKKALMLSARREPDSGRAAGKRGGAQAPPAGTHRGTTTLRWTSQSRHAALVSVVRSWRTLPAASEGFESPVVVGSFTLAVSSFILKGFHLPSPADEKAHERSVSCFYILTLVGCGVVSFWEMAFNCLLGSILPCRGCIDLFVYLLICLKGFPVFSSNPGVLFWMDGEELTGQAK